MYNKDFVKKVFIGEKILFKVNDVSYIIVPIYEEISVPKVLNMVKDDVDIQSYFPDEFFTKKIP
jgi:hypothetical protein